MFDPNTDRDSDLIPDLEFDPIETIAINTVEAT
jgi:hypothetical protein